MTTENGLTITTTRALSTPLEFTDDQRRMIRDSFANGASDGEFAVLMEIAKARRLNPLLRQVHFVSRWDTSKGREVWATQVSIDGLRAIAERTGLYAGQDKPEFTERPDGSIVSCEVRVYRKDWPRPAVGVAYWSEYVQTRKDKASGKLFPTSFWQRMPHTMLAKCAEALALRKAFPEDMSGLYTADEMGQAENDPVIVDASPAVDSREDFTAMDASRQIAAPVARYDAAAYAGVGDADAREMPPALAAFYEDLAGIELPGESVAVWMKHRADLATLLSAYRETAWKALCARTEEVGKMKNARVWLKKAVVEEDARRGMVSVEPAPSKRILDDVRESAAARHTVRELADLWRSARAEIKAAKADAAGWKILADRALALGLVPGEVKAEIARLDAPPPPDGTDGPHAPRSAANDTATAEGSVAPSSGTDGPVALAAPDAWRLSATAITAHVAKIGNIPRLANSARRNLGAIVEPLRTHAVHAYAGRLQRLSVDGDGSTLAWEACVERAETWLREGPKDAAPPPQRRTRRAA